MDPISYLWTIVLILFPGIVAGVVVFRNSSSRGKALRSLAIFNIVFAIIWLFWYRSELFSAFGAPNAGVGLLFSILIIVVGFFVLINGTIFVMAFQRIRLLVMVVLALILSGLLANNFVLQPVKTGLLKFKDIQNHRDHDKKLKENHFKEWKENENIEEAISQAHSYSKRHPKDMEALLVRANLHLAMPKPQYISAWMDAETIVENDPDCAEAHAIIAKASIDREKYKISKKAIEFALKLDPDKREWIEIRALANHKLKDYDKAILDYSKAISLDSNKSSSAALYSSRAAVYLNMGKFKECVQDLNKSLELEPKNSKALEGFANLYIKQKKFDKVVVQYENLTQLNPNDHDYLKKLVKYLLKTGKRKQAVAFVKNAAKDHSNCRIVRDLSKSLNIKYVVH